MQKPNPEGIYKSCQKVNIQTNKTAYISDTLTDLKMAENANIFSKIGVLTGLGTKSELALKGDIVCKNLNELKNIL